jgi:hypothetical protein
MCDIVTARPGGAVTLAAGMADILPLARDA